MGIRGDVLDIRVRPHEDETHPTEPICRKRQMPSHPGSPGI